MDRATIYHKHAEDNRSQRRDMLGHIGNTFGFALMWNRFFDPVALYEY
jgi:hypothetical protein